MAINIGIALSIRDKSTRMPSKTWALLNKQPMIEFMIERLNYSGVPLFVATSDESGDDLIAALQSAKVKIFRGDAEDKLLRYLDLCKEESLDFLVVVDGDDPLIDLSKVKQVVDTANSGEHNLVSFQNFALGTSPIGISRDLLEFAVLNKTQRDSEVWLSFVRGLSDCREIVISNLQSEDVANIRLTVDYPEDLLLIDICLEILQGNSKTPTENVTNLLVKFPALTRINSWRNLEYNEIILKKSDIL